MPMFEENEAVRKRNGSGRRSTSPEPRPFAAADVPVDPPPSLSHRLSEESIRTELCEGPLLESPTTYSPMLFPSHTPPSYLSPSHASPSRPSHSSSAFSPPAPPPQKPLSPQPPKTPDVPTSDRSELIERLKRGESPTWIPSRHHEPYWGQTSPSPTRPPSTHTSLLPPADILPEKPPLEDDVQTTEQEDAAAAEAAAARLEAGRHIERPRSALHSGDFTHHSRPDADTDADTNTSLRLQTQNMQSVSGFQEDTAPWLSLFAMPTGRPPPSALADLGIFRSRRQSSLSSSTSSSLSHSFVYKPPTSPLVQSESNDDEVVDERDQFSNSLTNARRHTMSSALVYPQIYHHSYNSLTSSPLPMQSLPRPSPAALLREASAPSPVPYQAHQPRRSLSSLSSLSSFSSISSVSQQPRRPSFLEAASPRKRTSMVGSYEESILRGRMSTTPSKPLEFIAKIGVLGRGTHCKPSLRCPPHVTLPFSAVFYSYATTPHGRHKSEDGPSPYVGMVDLENGLPNPEAEQRSRRKRTAAETRTQEAAVDASDVLMSGVTSDMPLKSDMPRKRTPKARAPPGGSYRIPQQGQLQIIIKNQNKTAVKLFLVPYDLSDMEPGTKTFIRQRSYSAGPMIDVPDKEAKEAKEPKDTKEEQPVLRYLIHLHICCPSRGRYYLYNNMRVVFANRVPDDKEKLRNELKFPEPRYSVYKPVRVMSGHVGSPNVGTMSMSMMEREKAYRRRSSGFFGGGGGGARMETQQLPTAAFPQPIRTSSVGSPLSGFFERPTSSQASSERPSSGSDDLQQQKEKEKEKETYYNKLHKGDAGYGGGGMAAEGLLSQRLRSLEMQHNNSNNSNINSSINSTKDV